MGSVLLTDDSLASYLREEADDVLRNAGLEMLKLRGPKSVDLGISLLTDRDSDVVLQAVTLLDHLKDPRALEPLRGVLRHANANVVQAAIVAIGQLGHAAAGEDLIPFLTGEPWFQVAAIQALGNLRAANAIDPLSQLLDDPMVGGFAAEALMWIGGPGAFQHLAQYWLTDRADGDKPIELLAHVLEGLIESAPEMPGLRDAIAARMNYTAGSLGIAAARCLLALGAGPQDAEALRVLAGSTSDGTVLPACLARRKDLIAKLISERGVRRSWGFLLAARYPGFVRLSELAAVLSTSAGHHQLMAISQALSKIESAELGPAMLKFYQGLPEVALPTWGPLMLQHREAILPAMDRSPNLEENTKVVLSAILQESPADVAQAIVKMSPTLRKQALSQVMDRNDVVRELPWIEWLKEDLDRYGSMAATVAERAELGKMLPEIRKLLSTTPTRDLIRMVSNLNDEESVTTLVELLDRSDIALQPFLIGALGSIGGDEARNALRTVARSGGPRWARMAYKALSLCATREDEPFFRSVVRNPDWYIRLSCVHVLGKTLRAEDTQILTQLAADPVGLVAHRARAALER
jgi:HEAT repeat protein